MFRSSLDHPQGKLTSKQTQAKHRRITKHIQSFVLQNSLRKVLRRFEFVNI